VGNGYIFVHRYLMEYFAGPENPHRQTQFGGKTCQVFKVLMANM
jgi:hypothetical protein